MRQGKAELSRSPGATLNPGFEGLALDVAEPAR